MVEQAIDQFERIHDPVDSTAQHRPAHWAPGEENSALQYQHVFRALREQTRETSRTPAHKRRTS